MSTRMEAQKKKKRTRQARQRARHRFWIWSFYGLAGVMILVLVLGLVLPNMAGRDLSLGPGEFIPSLGNAHTPSLDTPHRPYNSDPPTSGPHMKYLATWGVHDTPIPKEVQVHNLEDGGVIVHYQPEAPEEVVARLKEIVERHEEGVILAPYPGLETMIALTAWTRLERMDELDEERIRRFIKAYRGIDHHAR
ncbi:MAG: DUF3105 domain-containing protein [Dehalococcoidia bacterium]